MSPFYGGNNPEYVKNITETSNVHLLNTPLLRMLKDYLEWETYFECNS